MKHTWSKQVLVSFQISADSWYNDQSDIINTNYNRTSFLTPTVHPHCVNKSAVICRKIVSAHMCQVVCRPKQNKKLNNGAKTTIKNAHHLMQSKSPPCFKWCTSDITSQKIQNWTGSCSFVDYRWECQYFMANTEKTRVSSELRFDIWDYYR